MRRVVGQLLFRGRRFRVVDVGLGWGWEVEM
jgi:hypothetical protein